MYKDKDKQREANAERQRRYKAKQKALLSEGVTDKALPDGNMSYDVYEKMEAGCNRSSTLHPAIIATINRLTTNPDGTVDEQARTNRMAIALDYERKFPGRPYTGAGI